MLVSAGGPLVLRVARIAQFCMDQAAVCASALACTHITHMQAHQVVAHTHIQTCSQTCTRPHARMHRSTNTQPARAPADLVGKKRSAHCIVLSPAAAPCACLGAGAKGLPTTSQARDLQACIHIHTPWIPQLKAHPHTSIALKRRSDTRAACSRGAHTHAQSIHTCPGQHTQAHGIQGLLPAPLQRGGCALCLECIAAEACTHLPQLSKCTLT